MAVLLTNSQLKLKCLGLALVATLMVGCMTPAGHLQATGVSQHVPCMPAPVANCPPQCCQTEESVWQTLTCDAKSMATRENAIWLGTTLAGSLVVREAWDDDVRRYTARHAESHESRYGDLHDTLDACGQPAIQWGLLFALHEVGDWTNDSQLTQSTGAAMSSLGLTTAATFAIKGIADTDRPTDAVSGGRYGFPSYHTSSSFALAAVADEYYGKSVGLPAYGLATLVGWSRIDGRDHDLSDVLFGAALGYAIGKSVATRHQERDSTVRLLPYIESPEAVGGMTLETRF